MRRALGCCAVLLWLAPAWGDDRAEALEKQGPLTLSLTPAAKNGAVNLKLSDSLVVTVSAGGPGSLEIQPPRTLTVSPAWKPGPVTKQTEDGSIGWRQTYVLYPVAPGQHVLQVEPFRYRTDSGEWSVAEWKPIPVNVTTQIVDADVKTLRDITDIERLPPTRSIWSWAVWIVAAGFAAGLLLFAIRKWRRWRRPGVTLNAEQWACRELDRVLARRLAEAGKVERFHTLLSNVVRRYLENRFHLPARRQTTPEFLQLMERSSVLTGDQQTLLRKFLEGCDLAKFAQAQPSLQECLATAAMAREFVQQTTGKKSIRGEERLC